MGILGSSTRANARAGMLDHLVGCVHRLLPRGGLLPEASWQARHRGILVILWLHALGFALFVLTQPDGLTAHTFAEVGGIWGLAAFATWRRPGRRLRTAMASLGLIASSALLVHLSGGLIEMHFHFFVALAVIALYEDWLPFLLALGYVVVDHGVMGVLQPTLIYDHPDAWANPWKWAGIHAAFILAASMASIIHWRVSEADRVRLTTAQDQRLRERAAREAAEAALRQEQAAQAARGQSEQRFRALVHNTSDLILILAPDGMLSYQSPSAQEIWGYPPGVLEGSDALSLVHPDDLAVARTFLTEVARQPGTNLHTELRLRHADGTWLACEVVANNLRGQAAVRGIVLTCHDVTARKTFEQQLEQLAFHDALTGLANRALFADRLEHALFRAERQSNAIAVLFLDLDNFKTINDSLGHEAGDQLLLAVAARLSACLRAEDTAARMGGDEFTVLLEEIVDRNEPLVVAERISAAFALPFALGGVNQAREVFVTASVGIVVSRPDQHDSPSSLLRDADLALYRSKATGKARHTLFEPSMGASALERLDLETDLRHALERQEFRVLYQPIVSLKGGRVVDVEALLRWEHPQHGTISPTVFIPLAEGNGLIVPIGRWVLVEACRQARIWQDRYPSAPPLVMSVNLSARQFQEPDLVADVARIVVDADLDPHTLKLEITESVLMHNADAAIDTMRALTALGIRLAIDDFGTGYSSLSYLKRFPVETIKIDRSFVHGLGIDQQDTAIVKSVVALAKTLGLSVTGEGVETPWQQAQLLALGCDRAQGYLFARPLAPDQMDIMLALAIERPVIHHGPDGLDAVLSLTDDNQLDQRAA